jgi:hypothetical protein
LTGSIKEAILPRMRTFVALSCSGCSLLLLVSCSSAFPPPALPPPTGVGTPRAADKVDLFLNKKPTKPYRTVGLFDSERPGISLTNPGSILSDTLSVAGRSGCDGVLVNTSTLLFRGVTQQDEIGLLVQMGVGDGTVAFFGYRVACIKYEPAATPPPASPGQSSSP